MSEERPNPVPRDDRSGSPLGSGPAPPRPGPPLSGRGPRPGSALQRPGSEAAFTPEQRLLVLDAWRRSGLPAGDFAPLVGLSRHTLYAWKKRFDVHGPAGLLDKPKGTPAGSRLPEATRRTILMLKEAHPDWGCQRISDLLLRGPALPASPTAVARVRPQGVGTGAAGAVTLPVAGAPDAAGRRRGSAVADQAGQAETQARRAGVASGRATQARSKCRHGARG